MTSAPFDSAQGALLRSSLSGVEESTAEGQKHYPSVAVCKPQLPNGENKAEANDVIATLRRIDMPKDSAAVPRIAEIAAAAKNPAHAAVRAKRIALRT